MPDARIIKFSRNRIELELPQRDDDFLDEFKFRVSSNKRQWNPDRGARGRWTIDSGIVELTKEILEDLGYTVNETIG